MNSHSYHCSHCKADVSKNIESCPSCNYLFINTVEGIANVKKIEAMAKRKKNAIVSFLIFAVFGLFLSGLFAGTMVEAGNNDELEWLLLGVGGFVIIISLIGTILSNQYIVLVHKMRRQATVVEESNPGSGPDSGYEFIYEYCDNGTYKWVCGFCDGENVTDEDRCLICGYLRTKR